MNVILEEHINGALGVGENRHQRGMFLKPSSIFYERGYSGRRFYKTLLDAQEAQYIELFNSGRKLVFLRHFGKKGCKLTMHFRESNGNGRASTVQCEKRRWHWKQWEPIRRTGGKNGSKTHMLTDGAGVPLSLIVAGANRHDVAELENVLSSAIVAAPKGKVTNLSADAGYTGNPALQVILFFGYIPHVRSRGEEKLLLESTPDFHARRWVVEACHSWTNRFRKLLVRFEKKLSSYLGLLELACAIIAFRKVIPVYPGFVISG